MPKGDIEIIVTVIMITLMVIGLYIVYSSSSPIGYLEHNGDTNYFFKKHLINVMVGIVAFMIFRRINLNFLVNISKYFLIIAIFLLVVVLFIPAGGSGVKRWIDLGFFSIQPSELARISLVLYLAYYLNKRYEQDEDILKTWKGFLPPVVLTGIIFILIAFEPHFGMAFILILTAVFMLWVGEMRFSHIILTAITTVPLLIVLVLNRGYRKSRIEAFLNFSGADPDKMYQSVQSLISLTSGGLWGKGLCASKQKLFYLPEPHTDFVFSVLGEELGFIGAFITIALLFTILFMGIRISILVEDRLKRLVAFGATLLIAFPIFINLAMTMNIIPVVGIPLPFISYGGSALLVTMSATGIICNVANSHNKSLKKRFQMYMEGKYGER
jgi:cell division protein FtsW